MSNAQKQRCNHHGDGSAVVSIKAREFFSLSLSLSIMVLEESMESLNVHKLLLLNMG